MKEIEQYCPKSKLEWRRWLDENHRSKDAVWLIFFKKSSPTPNLSWSEAVDEALCFGWIDSVKKTLDQERYIQFFSKRKATSTWSQTNKQKVEFLNKKDLMTKEGIKCIETAKANGMWTFLDSVDALEVPIDLEDEFQKHNGSKEYYESLSKSIKKQLLYWIVSAKRTETREKRVVAIVESAFHQTIPKQFK